jgi:hypothetical protein
VKFFNPNAHVIVVKVAIKANSERKDVKIVHMFSLPLEILCLIGGIITWEITHNIFLQNYS